VSENTSFSEISCLAPQDCYRKGPQLHQMAFSKVIPSAVVPGVGFLRSRFEKGLALEHRRAFWSIVDQAAVSSGNFFTVWYLARTLIPVEYGTFAVLLGVMFFANNIHAALIAFPLSVKSAEKPEYANTYTVWSILLTFALAPLSALSVLIAAIALGRMDLALLVCLAVLCWHLQETTRSALISRFRYRHALIGDSLSYIGRAVVIVILSTRGYRDLSTVFLAISATSCCATLVQIAQLGIQRLYSSGLCVYIANAWKIGSWWFYGRMTGVVTLQAFVWVLALRGGPAAAAEYQALITILAAINPILSSMNNIVLCSVSELYSRLGANAAVRSALRCFVAMALPISAYFAIVYGWPGFTLKVFYGAASPYRNFASVLQILVIAFAADTVACASLATLGGMQRTRYVFASQCVGAVVAVAVGLPCSFFWGLGAAVIGLSCVNTVKAAASTLLVLRVRNMSAPIRDMRNPVLAAEID